MNVEKKWLIKVVLHEIFTALMSVVQNPPHLLKFAPYLPKQICSKSHLSSSKSKFAAVPL